MEKENKRCDFIFVPLAKAISRFIVIPLDKVISALEGADKADVS
jgi:hypothetical protein